MEKGIFIQRQVSVILVDDEEHCLRSLEQCLINDKRINILASTIDPTVAIDTIISQKPDLLFMDIQMAGMSGFDVLEILEKTNIRPFVIFVTAFEHYAIQAVKAAAFDYLIKPIDRTEMAISLERVITKINQRETEKSYSRLLGYNSAKKIRFNTTGGFILINPEDILFIRADWNYSEIHTEKDKFELVTQNIGAIENYLPKEEFARINRSVIINLRYLEKIVRAKRLCILKKNNDIVSFNIPLRRIRSLESIL